MINNIDDSWKPFFFNGIDKEFFRQVEQLDGSLIYPKKGDIFRVFEMPLSKIKIIILGQDPYYKVNQATGLAFAVPESIRKPASLRIIEKELGHHIDRTMKHWTNQGVFLMNTALTVARGKPGTYINLWNPFIKKVISYISKDHPAIWMLWGKHAQSYIEYIDNYVFNTRLKGEEDKNVVLIASHPAAEVYKSNAGFLKCNHFNIANTLLGEQNKINW
jgi:uracil-DNA glycosylase